MEYELSESRMEHSAILFLLGLAYGTVTRKPVLTTMVIAFAASLLGQVIGIKKVTKQQTI